MMKPVVMAAQMPAWQLWYKHPGDPGTNYNFELEKFGLAVARLTDNESKEDSDSDYKSIPVMDALIEQAHLIEHM